MYKYTSPTIEARAARQQRARRVIIWQRVATAAAIIILIACILQAGAIDMEAARYAL